MQDIQTRNDEIAYMGQVFEMVLSIKSFLDRNSYYNNSERIQVEDLIDQKTMMAFDDFCTSATEYFTNPQVVSTVSTATSRNQEQKIGTSLLTRVAHSLSF